MKDQDFDTPFPWTLALMICSLSFFGFTRVMYTVNVAIPSLFIWISIISLVLGCISGMLFLIRKMKGKEL